MGQTGVNLHVRLKQHLYVFKHSYLRSTTGRHTAKCGCKLTSVKVVEYVDPSTGTREEQKAKRLERERYWIFRIQPKINPLQNL